MSRRAITIAEGLGLAGVAGVYLSLTSGTWFITPDSIDYLEGAQSLARGGAYAYADGTPATFFPVGTSAIYALAAAMPAPDYRYFSLLAKLLTIAYVALGYLLVRRHAGRGVAMVAASLMAVSPVVLLESTRVLSDIPYAVVLTLTFLWFDDGTLDDLTVRGAVGLGVLLAGAFLLRTVGIALWLGYLGALLTTVRRQRWRTVVVTTAVVGAAAAFHVLRARRIGGPSYGGVLFVRVPWMDDSGVPTLQDWLARLGVNARDLAVDLARVWGLDLVSVALAVAAVALTLLGAASLGLRRRSPLAWFFGFHVAAVLINGSVVRLVMPLLPVLAICIVSGVRTLAEAMRLAPNLRRLAIPLAMASAVPLWIHGAAEVRSTRRAIARVRGTPVVYRWHDGYIDLARGQVPSLAAGDVVATNHPKVLRYFLPPHVETATLPIRQSADAGYRALRATGATYLFCDKSEPLIWGSTLNVLRAHPTAFELLADAPDAAIYRLRR